MSCTKFLSPAGRARFFDVCVDAAGALVGIVLCLLTVFLWKKLRERRYT